MNSSDEFSIESDEDDFFAKDSSIAPRRDFESEKGVPSCPVVFDKGRKVCHVFVELTIYLVVDSKWQKDKRRKGIAQIGEAPFIVQNAGESEELSVEDFEPEVQLIKQGQQLYGGTTAILMKLFTPGKGKIYQFW